MPPGRIDPHDRTISEERPLVRAEPPNAETAPRALGEPITPARAHFVRSNFAVPRIDPQTHRLRVEGAVREPLELGLADLASLPFRRVAATLECAGNGRVAMDPLPRGEPWNGGAVGTAIWGGTPLVAVLERAGLRDGAVEILAEGADRGEKEGRGEIPFARSLPREKALDPDTLLAREMNGASILPEHGGPLRLLVPGWYGMASVKWVTRIEALATPFRGYFQGDRYVYEYRDGSDPVREMRVRSLITDPGAGEGVKRGRVRVAGWAWSGAGPIARVEVAVEGGGEWQEARVEPASARYGWARWEYDWEIAAAGRYALRSRATDAAGNVQPDVARWNVHGYGNNAVRPHFVTVL
jgi:DMSO/TMAO reductase YedYZ molybdopterin-dependent catalytic subunit